MSQTEDAAIPRKRSTEETRAEMRLDAVPPGFADTVFPQQTRNAQKLAISAFPDLTRECKAAFQRPASRFLQHIRRPYFGTSRFSSDEAAPAADGNRRFSMGA